MRVEGAADQLHRVEVVVGVHPRHVRRLVHADAVLAGDRAAVLDAQVEDRAADLLGRLAGALDGVVEEHQRVQVAVAGVEDVGHPDAGGRRTARRSRVSTSGSAVRGMTPSWTM